MSTFHNETIRINATGEDCSKPLIATHPTSKPLTTEERNLYAAMVDGIDRRLTLTATHGVTPAQALPIFSKQDHRHKLYVRNQQCWAHDLDLTSISPWNSQGGTRKAGTLISPRHAVWARHYSIKVNSTIRFVDNKNNVVDRKIIKERALPADPHLPGNFLHGRDMVVGLLDSDVPSSISFAKVLPKNFTEFHRATNMPIPVLSTDFEEKALVADWASMHGSMVGLMPPHEKLRVGYFESKIVGDSGNPTFLVIDNQLVFLFVFTYGGAGSGTSIQYHFDDVNKIMHQLGGGYSLTEVDISRYMSNSQITQVFG